MRFRLLLRAVQFSGSLLLCFIGFSTTYAQSPGHLSEEWYAAVEVNRPLLVVVAEMPLDSSLRMALQEHRLEQGYNLLLLPDTDTLAVFCERVNSILNEESINKKRVYLLGALSEEARAKYRMLNTKIVAAKHWVNLREIQEKKELDLIWGELYRNTLWTFDVEAIERKTKVEERSDRVETGIGLSLTTTINQFQSAGLGLPSGMRFISYNSYRRVYPRWNLNLSLEFGRKFPNPQDILFEEVIGQVDIFSLLSGDEVEIDLDTELTGYLGGSAGVGLSYLLPQKGKTTPYVGLDLRFFAASFFYLEVDTTITVSAGAGQGSFGYEEAGEDLESTSFYYLTLCPHIGMQQELGERWLLDLNVSYQVDPASLRAEPEQFSMLRFGMGLRYRLLGKRTIHYEYLRIAARP